MLLWLMNLDFAGGDGAVREPVGRGPVSGVVAAVVRECA